MPNNNQPVERVTWSEARADLADLINRVMYRRERLIITRHGKDVAELVPVGSEPIKLSPREEHPEYFAQR
jgi:prevent-host-death family protein